MLYLEALAPDVWTAAAPMVGELWLHNIRHSALDAAHMSHAYLIHKVFDELSQKPWNLVALEPSKAFEVIASMSDEDIEHKIGRQIKSLQQLGGPQNVLEKAFADQKGLRTVACQFHSCA